MFRRRGPSPQARILLAALLEDPHDWHHGYDLSKRTGLKSGTLYPLLIRLSDQGHLRATWRADDETSRPPRHVYRLTAPGIRFAKAALAVNRRSKVALRTAKTSS